MAVLSKKTIQRLAVLRVLSMWQNGAYGPVRVHKTLFFADKENEPNWHLFTFKKWRLGQFSDEIAFTLNDLLAAGRIKSVYDGPSERISALVADEWREQIDLFFKDNFSQWHGRLRGAFRKWAYLTNDSIIEKAHDDPTYTGKQHGDVIFASFPHELVEFAGLSDDMAERLNDMVDGRLQQKLLKRLSMAVDRPVTSEDWRHIYFGEPAIS